MARNKFDDDFLSALDSFLEKAHDVIVSRYSRSFPNLDPPTLYAPMKGVRKYVRVVRSDGYGASRSVHCFVEIETGDVFKAESWKAPAKHARGNIYAANPVAGMGPHGAAYLG